MSSDIVWGDKRKLKSKMKGKVFSDDELRVLEQVIELLTIRMELDYTGEEDVEWRRRERC